MSLKITKTPRIFCPKCDNLLSAISDFDGHTPKPNDFSLCAYCLTLLIVTEGNGMRLPTPAEEAEARATPAVQELRQALLHHRGPVTEMKRPHAK